MHSKYFHNTELIGGANQNFDVAAHMAAAFSGLIYKMWRHVLVRYSPVFYLKRITAGALK